MKVSRRLLAASATLVVSAASVTGITAAPAVAAPTPPTPNAAAARDLAARSVAGLVAGRPAFLHASTDDAFVPGAVISSGGTQYVPYQRTHAGLPVIGGDFVVATDNAGRVVYQSAALQHSIGSIPATPRLTEAAAVAVARRQLRTVTQVEGTRLVVDALGGTARLAWESTVDGTGADGISRLSVDVDAVTGAVLHRQEHVMHGSGTAAWNGPNPVPLNTSVSGGTFSMRDPAVTNLSCQDSANNTVFTGPDDLWGNGNATNRETGCVDALFGAQTEVKMLSQWLGRNAMDGNGGAWPIRVGLNQVNAFYDGTQVQVGHNNAGQWIGALDVIAHEMGHGVDDHTPGGISGGGTQEFIADTFGASTEWFANEPAPFDVPDFTVGEQINLVGSGPIRVMYNPSLKGDPNCYSSSIPSTEVHSAAGPGNHWFYLLAEGSSPINGQPASPTCNGSAVTGLGVQNAIRILYNAMLMKTTGSSYLRYRTWTLQAAKNLFPGSCTQFNSVKAAWDAVSVPAQAGDPTCTTGPQWSGWAQVPGGGATPSGPAATVFGTTMHVVVRGTDNAIYDNTLNGSWSGWGQLPGGGATPSSAAAAVFGGVLNVFVRGTDNAIYQNVFNGVSWTGWGQVPGGGATPSGPAATVLGGVLHLFVRGTDDAIYDNTFNGTSWSGWNQVPGGGATPDAPGATTLGGTLRLFVRGEDNAIYQNVFNGSSWTGWGQLPGGGATPSGPAATVLGSTLHVFVRGTDNAIYDNTSDGTSWSGWGQVPGGGATPDAPGATTFNGVLELFVRGTDNAIYLNQLG
ncbi:MAG TPA: M4 family metallopeptidase [Rugosimonospora sp.]|nr:M4 family metallopeptidase [Rugosimonospora sp.]